MRFSFLTKLEKVTDIRTRFDEKLFLFFSFRQDVRIYNLFLYSEAATF